MKRVACTSETEWTMLSDRSKVGMRLMEPGNSSRICGNKSLIDCATWTAFAPAWRETASTITDAGVAYPRA